MLDASVTSVVELDQLTRRADDRLYRAKDAGRQRIIGLCQTTKRLGAFNARHIGVLNIARRNAVDNPD